MKAQRGISRTCMNKCDTNDPHYGLEFFDEFLVRELETIAFTSPEGTAVDNSAIVVYRSRDLPYSLKKRDHSWIKSTPESLSHTLAGDVYTLDFVGETLL
ncbi:hypothetical protein EDD15DRAFT_179939 [Pisolithus albus]|nr:hypothetical protein EDD15DRAFT_179939 [Pisolithus albus]